jgi:hypothetical protein
MLHICHVLINIYELFDGEDPSVPEQPAHAAGARSSWDPGSMKVKTLWKKNSKSASERLLLSEEAYEAVFKSINSHIMAMQ